MPRVKRLRKRLPSAYRADWLARTDRRYRSVRRLLDHARVITADLGGASELSQVERDLVHRFVFIAGQVAEAEQLAVDGVAIDHDIYLRRVDAMRRLALVLGTRRRERTLPTLGDFLEQEPEESDAQA